MVFPCYYFVAKIATPIHFVVDRKQKKKTNPKAISHNMQCYLQQYDEREIIENMFYKMFLFSRLIYALVFFFPGCF